ncbi:uncharacterized protein ZBAI_01329 [Zygosaccharomyces bailii ISA1307]|nr:uncharacterized protein ZBAI_01329 [Zygosaccharomyces bailii ISA1307]
MVFHTKMTPEKEQQIASRILERAELAQMTRQLRLNLGKASEKRKGDPEISEAIRRVSPKKNSHSTPQRTTGTPPPPPPSRDAPREPATPNASRDDDGGADLLMYLATSPCASAKRGPSTPKAFSPGETLRYSHLKQNAASSPFKVSDSPMLYMVRGAHPSTPGRNDMRFNMGDYVHNLFSPSPGVNRGGIHATPLSLEKTNTAIMSSNSPGGHLKPGKVVRAKVNGDSLKENAIDSGSGSNGKMLAAQEAVKSE